jgi:hypothetical protein
MDDQSTTLIVAAFLMPERDVASQGVMSSFERTVGRPGVLFSASAVAAERKMLNTVARLLARSPGLCCRGASLHVIHNLGWSNLTVKNKVTYHRVFRGDLPPMPMSDLSFPLLDELLHRFPGSWGARS